MWNIRSPALIVRDARRYYRHVDHRATRARAAPHTALQIVPVVLQMRLQAARSICSADAVARTITAVFPAIHRCHPELVQCLTLSPSLSPFQPMLQSRRWHRLHLRLQRYRQRSQCPRRATKRLPRRDRVSHWLLTDATFLDTIAPAHRALQGLHQSAPVLR